jgi:hypothetical protein
VKRRAFNRYLGGVILGGSLTSQFVIAQAKQGSTNNAMLYGSASVDEQGLHWLVVFNEQAEQLLKHPLPSRAHQVLKHPSKPWVLVIARRPGQYLQIIDLETKALIKQLEPSAGQHFSGHMQISSDGKWLYTTENITDTSQGKVVVRDLNDFTVSEQFTSGGIGPHQLILDNQANVMVVANGGIHTKDRKKLNLESMQANLSYIDLVTKEVLEQAFLSKAHFQLSIRHIDINTAGEVAIAMQYQGERTDIVPLVATHKRGEELTFLEIPDNQYFQIKHYCGSVCYDSTGDTVAVSAPRGDRILFWQVRTANYIGSIKVRDGCGVARSSIKGHFAVSSGRGKLYQVDPLRQTKTSFMNDQSLQWDNHLATI